MLLSQLPALAQKDTLVQLPVVEVSATSLRNEPPGSFVEKWSGSDLSEHGASSVADFLQNQTGIYLKSYGSGSLATASIRGASASQTAVLWNGFQVQSPMLGLLDWSLLPVHFSDKITLQHGGNSASWGSGAIGGVVSMDNKPDFGIKRQLNLATGYGSFGSWNGQATAKFASQKVASATRFFYQKANNNFPYQPATGLPEKEQTNAGQKQKGLLQAFYFRPFANIQLGWHTWLQQNYREIPPTTTQNRSEANQEDKVFRSAFNFNWHFRQNIFQAKTAVFRESIRYRDELTGLDSPSHFLTNINELEWQRIFLKKFTLQLAGNQTYTKAFIKNYSGSTAVRHQSAMFASFRYRSSNFSAQLDGRQEVVDGKLVPFTPSFGAEQQLKNWLKFGAKLERNYRLPTLNDLYWTPGGNPDLLAESGWSSELNSQFTFKKNRSTFRFSTAIFNRNIKNWILWHPSPVQVFWSASNIAEVWSRGLENRLRYSWKSSKWHCQLLGGYDFVRSTNQKAVVLPKIEAGQQLIYVPENQGFISIEISFGAFSGKYRHQFTGSVLTELGELPSFQIGEFELGFERQIGGEPARLFFQINNLWDSNYRVIERRPMPGRSYQVGLSLNLSKK